MRRSPYIFPPAGSVGGAMTLDSDTLLARSGEPEP